MTENIAWLFAAFAVGWATIFLYLFWISQKERRLSRSIADLQKALEDENCRRQPDNPPV